MADIFLDVFDLLARAASATPAPHLNWSRGAGCHALQAMPHLWTVVITTVHNIMSSSSTGVSERHEEEPTANRTGFLPWENDLEMISKFLDRKVI